MTTGRNIEATSEASDTVDLYERDFHQWTLVQAALIRAGRPGTADLENVAEEIEALGRKERAELEAAYRLISLHQLKRIFQPERSARSWVLTIVRERLHAARVLRDNPSLKPRMHDLFDSAYSDARKEAAAETSLPLSTFPHQAPFTLDQILDENFWAGSASHDDGS